MFKKILIANRGEIACRVIKTARRLGAQTVAVYSDADAHALHVRMADEAVYLGPPPSAESYLLAEKIIEAAKAVGAEAIHPGYGFLSENADFSRACEAAGIAFVGPKPATIEAMGSKAKAKQLMAEARVPMLTGYQGEDQSLATFQAEAEKIGYPVLLKAAAGGGGKGMRIVGRAADLEGELESAKREAMSAFGDDRFIVEKFLAAPRHVEVQVFGDTHGNIVHLFERDCSVQRRYQKVIEEAPAPNIPDAVRSALHQAAVDAARQVDYVGAGTVEFLYDGADGVFFMEMNTRLQVEHPVTEEITGLDLVEWQLRVAAGEPLPKAQSEIQPCGHAIEVRLYAEDPADNYLPQIGRLTGFDFDEAEGLRLDSGIEAGDAVTPYYDPMVAKVIALGGDRDDARTVLADSLSTATITGLVTNRDFLIRILRHPEFAEKPPTTKFLTDNDLEKDDQDLSSMEIAAATLALASEEGHGFGVPGFRLNRPARTSAVFERSKEPLSAAVTQGVDGWALELSGDTIPFTISDDAEGLTFATDDVSVRIEGAWCDETTVYLQTTDGVKRAPLFGIFASAGAGDAEAAALSSPMPATVTGVLVEAGASVTAGQPLVTLEAMKMETVIKAPHDGTVTALHFAKGDSAPKGALLLDLEDN